MPQIHDSSSSHLAHENNQQDRGGHNNAATFGVIVAVIAVLVVVGIKIINTSNEDTTEKFYNQMGANIITKKTFLDFKYSHDLIEGAMNSIELKSKKAYESHQQKNLFKKDLQRYKPDLKQSLKLQLKRDKLPEDLDLKIDLITNQGEYMKSGKETYLDIELSGEYGGTHYVAFGVLGFMEDPSDNTSVITGVSVYREEWNEQDDVRMKVEKWDKQDVERYIQYELYKRIYPKMGEKYRKRINSKKDLDFKKIEHPEHGNKINCGFSKTHIIFINDKSGSMSDHDGGKSTPQYGFIKQKSYLNNRLGCLFSGMQDFIKVRHENDCNDIITTILFDGDATIATKKMSLSESFIQDNLIKYEPRGSTNFGAAFKKADTLIEYQENTVVIFLTDGHSNDNGASDTVSKWKQKMGDKLRLYCVGIGAGSTLTEIRKICDAGDGEMREALNGLEVIGAYQDIVWKEVRRK